MKKRFYRFSILLNIAFFIMFLFLVFYKWETITAKVNQLLVKSPTENELLEYNNTDFSYYEEKIIIDPNYSYTSILFIGNSITMHGKKEGLWDYQSGMAASSIEKDYVHLLCNKIANNYDQNISLFIFSIADYERNFERYNKESFNSRYGLKPNIVILQMGENVAIKKLKDNSALFTNLTVDILNGFDESRKIITLPFWPDVTKNELWTNIALKSNSIIVDLSHLGSGLDARCFAKNEKKYENKGVGMHPGDFGMEQIANCLYSVLGG